MQTHKEEEGISFVPSLPGAEEMCPFLLFSCACLLLANFLKGFAYDLLCSMSLTMYYVPLTAFKPQ